MAITILLWIAVAAMVLVGLAGTVFPVLPGTPMIFVGFLIAASIDNFQRVGWITLTFLGLLGVIGVAVDFVASAMGAKRAGASGWAIFGATVGTVVGVFFFPPFGLILGPFLGAFAGEYFANQELRKASSVGVATGIATIVGMCLKIAISFSMIGIFVFFYFV